MGEVPEVNDLISALKSLKNFADMTDFLVSHVWSFLNQVKQKTILFRNRALEYFRGNYDHYELSQEEKAAFAEKTSTAT